MKNPVFVIVLLALGLVFVSYKWATAPSAHEPAAEAKADTASIAYNEIMTRASVRAYADRPVSEGMIDTLLHAAMAAPTAVNKQPWRFVVIRDRQTLDYIGDNFGSMSMAKSAPLAIVVCGDLSAALDGEGREYWVQDASAATENLLLAAHACGLGAVWCGVYPIADRVQLFSELLHLPDNIVPLNCIVIGYPSGVTTPKDKWKPENVRYETWD